MKKKLFILILLSIPTIAQQSILRINNTDGTKYYTYVNDIKNISFFKCGQQVNYEGITYKTVFIGSQCWFKENLNVGTMINSDTEQSDNGGNNLIEKYCYENIASNCDTYGGLYMWDEAMTYNDVEGFQGICPQDWHIPTLAELETLKSEVGNDGNALKAIGEGSGDGAGTNTSGFSALIAGLVSSAGHGKFWYDDDTGYFNSAKYTGEMLLVENKNTINIFEGADKNFALSIRCIMDSVD